ncbi:MAG TPA: MBG domain-containing protein, partial [Acidobacteriaceae bacterium]|nr:MBG domain-containing protein [Acidobacteriaceae bacterium]
MTFLDSQILISDNTLSSPSSVAVDVAGNVYVADSGNNRVLEIPVTASGFGPSVTLIDNLSHPGGVLVDWEGNLYISDSGNNRIVRLLAGPGGFGPPTTVASSLNAPGGLAIDSSDNLFVADTGNNRVVKFPAQGANFGAAIVIGSGFNAPSGVAIDPANNLFVADTGNNRIAKFTVASAYTTVTYLYTAITSPAGVAVDASYNLFIASSNSHRVYEAPWNVGANRYNSNVILGNGWNMAVGVAADSKGNFYIVDAGAGRVWEIPTATQAFSPTAVGVVGSLQSYNFTLAAGTSIGGYAVLTQGSPSLDFADAGGSTCTPQTAVAASFCSVQVQFQPVGSGVRQGAVVLYDANGNVLVTAYLFGTGIGAQTAFFPPQQLALGSNLSGPSGVAVDAAGNVYISDTGNNRIVEIPWANGAYGSQITLPVTQLNTPMGLAVDGAGNLYIASSGNDKIIELPRTASGFGPQIKIPVAVYVPSAVTFDGSGALYIADTYDNLIVKLVWKGTAYSNVGPLGSYVKMPMGVAVDVTGNLFFSNPYLNNLIEVPWKSGKYQPQWTAATSRISYPTSVATDRNGDVYLLDTGNNRVLMYPATASGLGAQITVASGFNAPIGMTTDAGGNLYVADTGNNRIIRMSLGQPAPLSFLSTYVNTTSKDSAQSTLVQNTGNVATSIAAVSYPSDFPEDPSSTTSCVPGMALALGAGCPLAIDFSPQSVGALTESVSVSIAASAAQQTASVTASGVSLPRSNQTISFSQIANVTFGAAALKLSASASSGLAVTFQVVSGPATLASNGVTLTITGAGAITIAASQAGNSTYLAAQPVLVSFTVLPATLTITPNNATATYGAMPTSFGYSITGFVLGQNAGQVITGAPQITIDAGATAAVGAHALLAAIGTLQAANYQFVFNQGTLTVKQAALKIAAVSTSMTYGAALPKFTWTASGFVNADTLAVVSGAPQFATSASSRSAAGSYSITPAVGTLSAANYSLTFVAGA